MESRCKAVHTPSAHFPTKSHIGQEIVAHLRALSISPRGSTHAKDSSGKPQELHSVIFKSFRLLLKTLN